MLHESENSEKEERMKFLTLNFKRICIELFKIILVQEFAQTCLKQSKDHFISSLVLSSKLIGTL